MKKVKKTALLSLTVLPSAFSVLSCSKINDNQDDKGNNGNQDDKDNKKDAEIKRMHAQINKIKSFLNEGIDGSKDFTPSQSLADINVQKRINEKIKDLCGDLQNINCIPQLKSQYFKPGSDNYVDVEIICTKEDFQVCSMYHNLQIKDVKQDLEELVDKALEDLKGPIDFSKSFLIENDDFNYDIIENEFINVLNNQLEQEDERLSIRLINKSQDLVNNGKITVEVIGKDDNEEIRKTIQVTPIELSTVENYISGLVIKIPITRDDKLFAASQYTPYYWKEDVNAIIKAKFIQKNSNQLRRREIEKFVLNNSNSIVKFKKGVDLVTILLQLKYNKSCSQINLILTEIENHPEFILNEVADYYKNNGLDLSNELIFEDSDFESNDIKNKIIKIMQTNKERIDEKNDIEMKIVYYYPTLKRYNVTFFHNKPGIIDRWESSRSISWIPLQLKNLQTSPHQDLSNFMDKLTTNNTVKIVPVHFNSLSKFDLNKELEIKAKSLNLNSYLENSIRTGLSFDNLPGYGQDALNITPKRIISKDSTSIEVEYEFEFKKSEMPASIIKKIIFIQ